METIALWRLYYYSRYGETKEIGHAVFSDMALPFNVKGYWLNDQPCCFSKDIITENIDYLI